MIIQSDNMNMGASRRFSSTRASQTRRGSGSFLQINAARSSQSIYSASRNGHPAAYASSQKEDAADTKKSAERGNASGNSSKKSSLNDLMEQMRGSYSVRRVSLQDNAAAFHRVRQQSINYLMSLLLGRKYVEDTAPLMADENESFTQILDHSSTAGGEFSASGTYYSSFYYNEEENTCFDAQGTAVTADGRRLTFGISLEMSRSFTEMTASQIDFSQPKLCDPLVINLGCHATSVSDQKFFFDIDADGTKESVSMLHSGSGYLALDKNGDGVIGDGSELFGTQSGNGFQDLLAYDKDKNGWIDEADEIFQKLRIWTKDAQGNDELLTLAEAGVGAIYLGYEDTDFSLNSMEDNSVNAVIRKTGIFLYENGSSGTVQQLDLAT